MRLLLNPPFLILPTKKTLRAGILFLTLLLLHSCYPYTHSFSSSTLPTRLLLNTLFSDSTQEHTSISLFRSLLHSAIPTHPHSPLLTLTHFHSFILYPASIPQPLFLILPTKNTRAGYSYLSLFHSYSNSTLLTTLSTIISASTFPHALNPHFTISTHSCSSHASSSQTLLPPHVTQHLASLS